MTRERINTQLPRRTKVRSTTPLTSEWEVTDGAPPRALKTPADKMVHHSTNPFTSPEDIGSSLTASKKPTQQ
ncbi:MAG: hypothetical protein NBKEAIPA_00901 [Nitrospirae bacterium]|nr:MAG: hypothetical protein UZ03_NOB001001056 [Nitrospira sp. OLB3]MBV6469018.1 hypothetical protein [Nitrospirota bacterium]